MCFLFSPAGCADSLIEELHHFHVLGDDQVRRSLLLIGRFFLLCQLTEASPLEPSRCLHPHYILFVCDTIQVKMQVRCKLGQNSVGMVCFSEYT